MASSSTSPPRRPYRILAGLLGAAVAAAVLAVMMGRSRHAVEPPQPDHPTALVSPYRNVQPGVKYVGDTTCGQCHVSEAETFRRHPMNRTLAPVHQTTLGVQDGEEAHNPFEKFGVHFLVAMRDGRMFHRQSRQDAQGTVLVEHEDEMQLTIGSGTRGHSYLFERAGGYLFLSPISWFSQQKTWGITPGFQPAWLDGKAVESKCLFCHSNPIELVGESVNRYRLATFSGSGVGCERCHGPGELHVASRERGEAVEGFDDTIINPIRLEPGLREAVCQQCHLTGRYRILRQDRAPFDFRPGQPLYLSWNVFGKPPRLAENYRDASRVEQMVASRCFQASAGKMGCISCHDPHAVPLPSERIGFYRSRCLRCHEETSCTLPPAARRETSREDSCMQCHMPRLSEVHVAHTTDTDHRILRKPDPAAPPGRHVLKPGELPLVSFYAASLAGDPGASRDQGIALVDLAEDYPPLRTHAVALALPLLEQAVRRQSQDAVAWEAKAKAFRLQGRDESALRDLEIALAEAPQRETALCEAAAAARAVGDRAKALAYRQRALAVNPWPAAYHHHVAELYAEGRQWQQAMQECQAALRVDPANVDVRALRISCLIQTGDRARAEAEFATLAALNPPHLEELRRWFAAQKR